jgi:hypothetical protein
MVQPDDGGKAYRRRYMYDDHLSSEVPICRSAVAHSYTQADRDDADGVFQEVCGILLHYAATPQGSASSLSTALQCNVVKDFWRRTSPEVDGMEPFISYMGADGGIAEVQRRASSTVNGRFRPAPKHWTNLVKAWARRIDTSGRNKNMQYDAHCFVHGEAPTDMRRAPCFTFGRGAFEVFMGLDRRRHEHVHRHRLHRHARLRQHACPGVRDMRPRRQPLPHPGVVSRYDRHASRASRRPSQKAGAARVH